MKTFANRDELRVRMNRELNIAIEKAHRQHWHNQYLTVKQLLCCLKDEFSAIQLSQNKLIAKNASARLKVYENNKSAEETESAKRIGVLTRFNYSQDKFLDGVMIYSVNIANINKSNEALTQFEEPGLAEANIEQLFSPAHQTLLLDFVNFNDHHSAVSVVLPSRHFCKINERSRKLITYCDDFSQSLINDCMFGSNLNYNDIPVNYLKGYIESCNAPDFLISINASAQESHRLNGSFADINEKLYSPIISEEMGQMLQFSAKNQSGRD